ncbi:MAG: HalOD1 output domain-containing protein [Halorhabdus sp.]
MTRYSVQIVHRVADKEDVHPTELDCTLGDVVDPEALDQLLESLEENGQDSVGVLRFGFCGYTVRVSEAGDIDLQ